MTQHDEYHLHRGESEYLLEIAYEWSYGLADGEPVDAELVIQDVQVWGRWDGPGMDAGPGEFIEPLPLDPPLTKEEIDGFEERLRDLAATAAEDRWDSR